MEVNQSSLEDWVEEYLARKRIEQNNDCEQLTRLTIVIPSYERQVFLLRQAVYWGYRRANVIIVDGSREPLSDRMRRVMAELPNLHYIHAKESFAQRMKLAAALIRTPYAAMLGDDEFFLTNGLCKAITRLDDDAGLVACCGQPVGFYYSRLSKSIEYLNSYTTYWRYEISESSVQDRLRKALATINSSTCYAVLRREAWIEGWGELQPWSSPGAMDIHQIAVTCIYGKLASVDDVIWLRSSENSIITNEKTVHAAYDLRHTFPRWWRSATYADEREDFVGRLAKSVEARLNLSDGESRRTIEDAVDVYLAICAKQQKFSLVRSLRNVVRATISQVLRRFVPPQRVLAIKLRFQKLAGSKPPEISGGSACGGIRLFGPNIPIYDPAELKSIESLVLEFYEAAARERNFTMKDRH